MYLLSSSFKIYNVGARFISLTCVKKQRRGQIYLAHRTGHVYVARVSTSKEEDNIDSSRSKSRGVPSLRRNRRNHDRRA
jgi:hypothetical protein